MGMSTIIDLRKETVLSSEMNLLWCEMCSSISENKSKRPESVIIHRETSPVLTWTEKVMLWRYFAAGGTGALHKIDGIVRK